MSRLSANAGPGVSVPALASPAFVALLLTKVSGGSHPEKSADERWGSEAKYQEYKRSTPCLVPRLPGWGARRRCEGRDAGRARRQTEANVREDARARETTEGGQSS